MSQIVLFVFGAIVAAVGIEAFVAKQSVPSLIAGLVFGILAVLAGIVAKKSPKWGAFGGIVVAVLLSGRFVSALVKGTGTFWPAGFLVGLAVLTVALLIPDAIRKSSGN